MPRKIRLTPVRLLVLGYLAVILLGTILLILPFSSKIPGRADFMDALFTTVSASCVTGLILHDTFQYWSGFGQVVILCLIQMGGVGFMTIIFLLLKLSGKRIGLKERTFMQESVSAPNVAGMVKLTSTILLGTLIFEAAGAIVLAFRFVPDFGWGQGIWFAVFTSVSSFCNAGFDLMGARGTPFASLTSYAGDPIICLTVPLLILIGGLGFAVWKDLCDNKFRLRRLALHTKLVLVMTAVMVVVPTAIIMIAERGMPFGDLLLNSFFTAVSPRTAGFNVLDLTSVQTATVFVTIGCMFIGGSSGSTAGGIKTNTFAVLFLSLVSFIRGKRSVECFGRRIDDDNVKTASRFVTLYLLFAALGVVLICLFEQGKGFELTEIVFEVFSAIGTVGLTLGITPSLCVGSELVLSCLMFLGRAGCLTVMLSLRTPSAPAAELPVEKVRIA